MGELIVVAAGAALFYMTLWAIIALLRKRNDIADIAWGLGFVTIAWSLFVYSDTNLSLKTTLILFTVTVWGARLALHIADRHKKNQEDKRYIEMRKKWKYKRLQAYTNVFLSQGFFMLLVGAPIIFYFARGSSDISWYNWLGLVIWAVGFVFEAVGDYQLRKFIRFGKSKKNRVMTDGLWKFTRHPNYFGEVSLWWGFLLLTLPYEAWYLALIGPITITYLILGISGIPMLEKRYEGNKEYDEYKKRTNAFFPGPQKN